MSAKTLTKPVKTAQKITKRLVIGDRVLSATGKQLLVTMVIQKENRTIVMFDGDMEIDFDPYLPVNVVE